MGENKQEPEEGLAQEQARADSLLRELAFLFGESIVTQADLLDVADLNMTDEMTTQIGQGIKQLKALKHDPRAQQQWIAEQTPALQLLLCLWIMDMDLLEKLQTRSYLEL